MTGAEGLVRLRESERCRLDLSSRIGHWADGRFRAELGRSGWARGGSVPSGRGRRRGWPPNPWIGVLTLSGRKAASMTRTGERTRWSAGTVFGPRAPVLSALKAGSSNRFVASTCRYCYTSSDQAERRPASCPEWALDSRSHWWIRILWRERLVLPVRRSIRNIDPDGNARIAG